MTESTPPFDPRTLNRHAHFLQALAANLVHDEARAQDLTQDAMVAALERPPRRPAGLQQWLSTVVRNQAFRGWRTRERRSRREASVARAESLPSAAEIAARAEVNRLLAEAVAELGEHYRSVIHLRFYEGLSPAEIAARSGTPKETIRARIRRALEQLRERLDREFGGDRSVWCGVLTAGSIPTASGPGATLATLEVMGMGIKAMVIVATVAVGLASLFIWRSGEGTPRATGEGGDGVFPADLELPGAPDADLASSPDSPDRRLVVASTEEEPGRDLATHFVFIGRVVDERRFPVAGAKVEMVFGEGPSPAMITDEQGHFRSLALPRPEDEGRIGFVRATMGADRAGIVRGCLEWPGQTSSASELDSLIPVREGVADLGAVVLGTASELSVRIVQESDPVPGAEVSIELLPWGPVFHRARSDAEGMVVLPHVPPGFHRVAACTLGLYAEETLILPDPAREELLLELRPSRSVEVLVIDEATRAGIAGAEVRLHEDVLMPALPQEPSDFMWNGEHFVRRGAESSIPPTDATGRTRVTGLSSYRRFSVHARARGYEGYLRPVSPHTEQLAPGAKTATVELSALTLRCVRWPIASGEVAVPLSGTPLTLRVPDSVGMFQRSNEPPSAVVVLDGTIVMEGIAPGEFEFIVETPDHAIALLAVPHEGAVGPEVSFERPRKVDVVVRDAIGTAVKGAAVRARPLTNRTWNEIDGAPVLTDADGRAVLGGFRGFEVGIGVTPPGGTRLDEVDAGSVDLRAGDGRLECTLHPVAEVVLHVTLAGVPGLPYDYFLYYENHSIQVLDEDPQKGELRVALTPENWGQEVPLSLGASGYAWKTVRWRPVPSEPPATLDFDLQPTSSIAVTLDDSSVEHFSLMAQTWNAEYEAWMKPWPGRPLSRPNAAGGTFRFEPLDPGRYRIREEFSGVTTEEVELGGEVISAKLHLAIPATEPVLGRIEAPAGTEFEEVRVLVEGIALETDERVARSGNDPRKGLKVGKDGKFRLNVPIDREVVLTAWHPFLLSDPEMGVARVRGGTGSLLLRLVPGNELQIPLVDSGLPWREKGVRLFRFGNGIGGAPDSVHFAPLHDGVLRVGGVPRGSCTLWLDPGSVFAPQIVRNVEIQEGVTRLGPVRFTVGSSVLLNVELPPGEEWDMAQYRIEHLGEPHYSRTGRGTVRGAVSYPVSGFGPGRFRVSVEGSGNGWPTTAEPIEIELDGRTDKSLYFRLR